jgi:tripartite-type tricarboxylate transporter receptor subunit TctC
MVVIQAKTGVKLSAVQYKGILPALTDVIAGHIHMMFISVGLMVQPWKAGQLRPLGVGSTGRLVSFPQLPTIAESVPGFSATSWFGLFAPARTPQDIVHKINLAVQRVLTDPTFHEQFLAPNFYESVTGSPGEFAAYIKSDSERWGKVIRDANLTGDE